MFCEKCGAAISETAKFCKKCGSPVVVDTTVKCPNCGAECDEETIFCEECGTRVRNSQQNGSYHSNQTYHNFDNTSSTTDTVPINAEPVQQQPVVTSSSSTNNYSAPEKPAQSGRLLKRVDTVSWYKGEVKFGYAKGTGNFSVYDDRIEFVQKLGRTLLSVGSNKTNVYLFSNISDVKESKFSGMFPSVIICLRNGERHTFSASIGGSALSECVRLIKKYL